MCRYVYGHMSTELHYPGFGQDVFGESPGCLKTYNVGPGALLTMKPKTWSFEEASLHGWWV